MKRGKRTNRKDKDKNIHFHIQSASVRRSPRNVKSTEKALAPPVIPPSSPSPAPPPAAPISPLPPSNTVLAPLPSAKPKELQPAVLSYKNSDEVVFGRKVEVSDESSELYQLARDWVKGSTNLSLSTPQDKVNENTAPLKKEVAWTNYPTSLNPTLKTDPTHHNAFDTILKEKNSDLFNTEDLLAEHIRHGKEIRQRARSQFSELLNHVALDPL